MTSEWVKTEIARARKSGVKEGKRVLFPVRLVGFERLRDWDVSTPIRRKIRHIR